MKVSNKEVIVSTFHATCSVERYREIGQYLQKNVRLTEVFTFFVFNWVHFRYVNWYDPGKRVRGREGIDSSPLERKRRLTLEKSRRICI